MQQRHALLLHALLLLAAGTTYGDFVQSVHLPAQLAAVDPIVASFCGGAVGVVSALLVREGLALGPQGVRQVGCGSKRQLCKEAPVGGADLPPRPCRPASPALAPAPSQVIEYNNVKKQQRNKCIYCSGTGYLTCGNCMGSGIDPVGRAGCTSCSSTGKVMCTGCLCTGKQMATEWVARVQEGRAGACGACLCECCGSGGSSAARRPASMLLRLRQVCGDAP